MGRADLPMPVTAMTAMVLVATFIAGAIVGIGADRWLRPHQQPSPMMALPLAELGLSPDQEARARAIIDAHRGELEAIVRANFPKVRAIHDQLAAELRPILSPDQQHRLDEWRRRRLPSRDQ